MNPLSPHTITNNENNVLISFLKSATDSMILTTDGGVILLANSATEKLITLDLYQNILSKNITHLLDFHPSHSINSNQSTTTLKDLLQKTQIFEATWVDIYQDNGAVSLTISSTQLQGKEHFIFVLRPILAESSPAFSKSNFDSIQQKENINLTEEVSQGNEQTNLPQDMTQEKLRVLLKNERELNRVKSKFISIASHEFRTPLSTILASADLIGRYAQKAGDTRYDRHVKRIKASIRNLTKVLENFLSLDKLEKGEEINQAQEIQLPSLIKKVIEEIQITLRSEQFIDLSLQLESEVITLDPKILRIVLINLLNNASKYSKEKMPIGLHISSTQKSIHIEVTDQGIGIPESDQPHIFTRFYRGQNTVRTSGAGLGLNIIQQYLKLVGGKVTFTSIINRGTTFDVWFPLK